MRKWAFVGISEAIKNLKEGCQSIVSFRDDRKLFPRELPRVFVAQKINVLAQRESWSEFCEFWI